MNPAAIFSRIPRDDVIRYRRGGDVAVNPAAFGSFPIPDGKSIHDRIRAFAAVEVESTGVTHILTIDDAVVRAVLGSDGYGFAVEVQVDVARSCIRPISYHHSRAVEGRVNRLPNGAIWVL